MSRTFTIGEQVCPPRRAQRARAARAASTTLGGHGRGAQSAARRWGATLIPLGAWITASTLDGQSWAHGNRVAGCLAGLTTDKEQQRYEEARGKLSAVWAARQSYDVATVLAQAELQVGKHRDAAEHLGYAVEHFPVSAKIELRKHVEAMFAEARGKVGTLKIEVTPAAATVTIEGRSYAEHERKGAVFVEPGKVTVVVSAPGHVTERRTLDVGKGGSEQVKLSLAREAPAERSMVPAFVMGGVGVVGAALGAGLLAGSLSDYDKARTLNQQIQSVGGTCNPGASSLDTRCEELAGTASSSNTLKVAGIVSLALSGAAVAGAVTYWLWPAARPRHHALRVVPALGAGEGAVFVIGRF